MTFRLVKSLAGYQPVYVDRAGVFLYRRGAIYRASPDLDAIQRIARIPHQHRLGQLPSRLIERVLRLHIQSAAMVDDQVLVVARRSVIWRIDLLTGEVDRDFEIPEGRYLLGFGEVTDPQGGMRHICFGDYFNNPARAAVSLWRRGAGPQGKWERRATFPAGAIDHIHAIVQQRSGRVLILTGDFEEAAGIWESDAGLSTLTPLATGRQAYRSCWLHEEADGSLISATDTQFETNHLQRLNLPDVTTVRPLPGSSIYAGRAGGGTVFSTSVEPGDSTGSTLRDILTREAGPGIAGHDAAIYVFEDGAAQEVHRARKDFWPMRLAQFGTFMFPGGDAGADRFYAFGAAVSPGDGACLMFERRS